MTRYYFAKAMRTLDHAIDSLGPTKACGLLIIDGRTSLLPATESIADESRAILVRAMLELAKEKTTK